LSWLWLVLSSLLQVGWLVSLKEAAGFTRLVPTISYVAFGFLSTLLLSWALRGIPMSTAYAVWTGVSVAGAVLADLLARRPIGPLHLACVVVILAGTTSLKLASAPASGADAEAPAVAEGARLPGSPPPSP
jgi:quaternary ammonium compound-resistance protein SugE